MNRWMRLNCTAVFLSHPRVSNLKVVDRKGGEEVKRLMIMMSQVVPLLKSQKERVDNIKEPFSDRYNS